MTSTNSANDSHKEVSDLISQLETVNAKYFCKVMPKSTVTAGVAGPFAYSLEFPIRFLMDHGSEFGYDVTFERTGSHQTWPIKITKKEVAACRPRVFAYGSGGWQAFVVDNGIQVGDFLIFSMVKSSHFCIHISKAERPLDIKPSTKVQEKSSWWNANEMSEPCKLCKQAPRCPRFVATIRSLAHPTHDVPASFWERQRPWLKSDELQLKGPNKDIMVVETARIYHEEEQTLSIRLESGWTAFLVANKLQAGDNLEFSLIGPSCFTVELLDRY